MKKFEVRFLEEHGTREEKDFYIREKFIFLTLGDQAQKEDVLNELIRLGYKGKVINIGEVK